ncbi:MAG: hypothetical protein OMM_01390 [Candidatus Magnetoglobus multicellularis str. Araruama]|uniref:Uncharacterized protein n=1 Tax=Candidatus Magnetoglobus multicellularis str. Araruama TaxID=890399 RepID=A0A1V1PD57_9BACT|nr:MAG: hypothetical protein OMM_01390 [Candidatus Magnetoglobus multicellularis str. Araruama]
MNKYQKNQLTNKTKQSLFYSYLTSVIIFLFPIITNCQEAVSFEIVPEKVNNLYNDSNKEMQCQYLISTLHALTGSRYGEKSIRYNFGDVDGNNCTDLKDGIALLAFLTDILNPGYNNISIQKVLSNTNTVSIKVGDVVVDYLNIVKMPVLLDNDISNNIIVAGVAFTVKFSPQIYIESVESDFFWHILFATRISGRRASLL